MSSKYKAEQDVYDLMKDAVANYHPDLALVVDEIAIVFKEKASKLGGKPVYGKASKANELFGVLTDNPIKFILEIAQDTWLDLSVRNRKALMDRLLSACRVEEDAETGAIKCSIAPYDVSYFFDELDRWGDWIPRPEDDGPQSPLERIFGKMAQPKDAPASKSEGGEDSEDSDDLESLLA